MILTFSSAITVKGALGDVARLRRFLSQKEYDVNKNHKSMDVEKLFLSTANSSKGLERDNVLAILTFPLERAFVNFSDDLVVNLLTVALTRARKKVVIYVPAYQDKFSRVLSLYQK
jgi:superfamily I DNA/RNA helicase